MRRVVPVALLALSLAACATGEGAAGLLPAVSAPATLRITSPELADGGALPARFTCDGQGLPPRLSWIESRPAAEFILVVTDPDAPGGAFVHWLVYGIVSNADSIGGGQGPSGARQGTNGFGRPGYGPPCPPRGERAHRYVFTIYALSKPRTNGMAAGATAGQVLERIACCVQEVGSISATYRR